MGANFDRLDRIGADSLDFAIDDKCAGNPRIGASVGAETRHVRGRGMAIASPVARRLAQEPRWLFSTAGSFTLTDRKHRRDATPRGRKARAILAYLAAHAGAKVPRERITELLWGDRGEAQARASLRQALLEIRRATPGTRELVRTDRGHVWIERADIDFAGVVDLGADDSRLFEDLDHVTREFDDWLRVERGRQSESRINALRIEAGELIAAGKAAAALPLIQAMERIDPFDEEALRLAMKADFDAGHAAAIEQRFRTTARRLREELGVEPSAESRSLHDLLLARLRGDPQEAKGLPKAVADRSAPAVPRPRPELPARPFGFRLWLALAIAAILILAFLLLWASGRFDRAIAAPPNRTAVLPFRGPGVDPSLGGGISEAFMSRQQAPGPPSGQCRQAGSFA